MDGFFGPPNDSGNHSIPGGKCSPASTSENLLSVTKPRLIHHSLKRGKEREREMEGERE